MYRVITYLASKMFDELAMTLFSSCAISAVVFYGVRLQGSFVLFWLIYYMTLGIGIGELLTASDEGLLAAYND